MGSDGDKKSTKHQKEEDLAYPAGGVAPLGEIEVDSDVMPGDEDFDLVVLDEAELLDEDDEFASTMAPFVAGHVEGDLLQANIAAVATASAEDVQANLSAIALSKSDSLTSIGSAIALASVEGDADINTSAVPLLIVKGDANFHQAYASGFVAGGTVDVRQAGAPIIVGRQLSVEQGGAVVAVGSQIDVKRGFVGVVLSPNATISDDTRVLLDPKAALIIAGALLGGFGLVAVAMLLGVRRVMQWRPQINFPSMPHPMAALRSHMPGHRRG